MVVSVDGVPVGGKEGATSRARPGAVSRTRRDLARGLYSCALIAALTSASAAARTRPRPGAAPGETAFDVVYRGRRIRGCGTAEDGPWHVTVDGRPLHLMRRADGTWLSMVDHYCSYPTPLEAARAAVDELGPGRQLRALHMGHRHGVRA